jgi:hypothetical protein
VGEKPERAESVIDGDDQYTVLGKCGAVENQ